MQKIITKFKMCKELGIRAAMQSKPENPDEEVQKEAGVRKFLGKDLAQMSSQELSELDDKLIKGLLFIKDTKLQLLKDEVEKSRMQQLQVVQKNQMLLRQANPSPTLYDK
ncbi:uncharacterized protein LOC131014586 [Salvia miltiorrhiza]|uniref:uncharacterized protein LOC131014586 n=1 Tax=Salvia miltiorrhiza TaxID=226208 RepID=UPI0025AB69DA|nr:uncharacterized protein LOC131014586 [Salvia miltiorrhiza]XP_057798580.1 uncharacterized protein LOC131014586 [Salvia miltiorrhiza]